MNWSSLANYNYRYLFAEGKFLIIIMKMSKVEWGQSKGLIYESPFVERILLPEGNNIPVSFSLELEFDDFEEVDDL